MIRESGNLYPEHSDSLGYGIPDFGKYVDTITVGYTQLSDLNKTLIYPNPFDDFIFFSNPTKIDKIELFAFDGHNILMTQKGDLPLNGFLSVNVSQLPKGIYIARVYLGNSIQAFKLIKQ